MAKFHVDNILIIKVTVMRKLSKTIPPIWKLICNYIPIWIITLKTNNFRPMHHISQDSSYADAITATNILEK